MADYRPNDHKIYQHLQLQDPPKFNQIGIFGLKIHHLATRISARFFKLFLLLFHFQKKKGWVGRDTHL
jgi:hypothetical protein